MINVIASIEIKEGKRAEFLNIFKAIVPTVKEENGCIDYFPAVDVDAQMPRQQMNASVVTVIEKWESLDALRKHLDAPHMTAYRQQAQNLIAGVSIKVLQEA